MFNTRGFVGLRSLPLASFAVLALAWIALLSGCHKKDERLEPRFLTWAEIRAVRSPVRITPPGEGERDTYPRERLADGARVKVEAGGLAWLRRDGGATLLVRGPARLTLRARSLVVDEGRVFVDTPPGSTSELVTPAGSLTLAAVRASLSVPAEGPPQAYVLSGEVRSQGGRARAGELLSLEKGGAVKVTPVLGWEDWTGGLATTDRVAAPAPFGVGTVGARRAGEQGSPRFPLSIQRMEVRVRVDGDFALTEVDQSFFNPSSETVEGLYGFRTPERAILQRFGVDREGVVVWGRVKEKGAAAAQYQANVYQGSTEDPALLEWDAPGAYKARLYPIGPGETRRVVVRYAEWLDRTGENGRRRLYTYPMAAEGSEESLPHVEELKVVFDLSRAGARDARIGMAGVKSGETIVVRAHDFVPRADLSLELFDEGAPPPRAYRAPHVVDLEPIAPEARAAAADKARGEADYLLVPVRPTEAKLPAGGLDLAIVIDASAATDTATLSMARAATTALLAHLSDQDRAVVLAGDDGLRPVVPGWDKLAKVDEASRLRVQDALSQVARGGATDLGAMLGAAARELDPARRSAVVYIGDAAPTVGELSLASLRERLSKLPAPVRVFGLGVGDDARLDILAGLSSGAFAVRVTDGYGAARAALRVLEETERPVWLGTKVDLGPGVERVYPSQVSALVSGETLWVVGRLSGKEPDSVKTSGPAGKHEAKLEVVRFDDQGDIGRRWAGERLAQMLEDGEGRASLVDLGMKSGIITPVTSFYVPTKNEMSTPERAELEARSAAARRQVLGGRGGEAEADGGRYDVQSQAVSAADNKEGGTGTRAQGDEGSMGNPSPKRGSSGGGLMGSLFGSKQEEASAAAAPMPAASAAPSPQPLELAPEPAPTAMADAAPQASKVSGPSKPLSRNAVEQSESPAPPGDTFGSGGLRLSGVGAGGGGKSPGMGLSDDRFLKKGAGAAVQPGFGAGQGRLGGAHAADSPKVRMGATTVTGRLPPEVIARIVRQSFGHFRLCYESGLRQNPKLEGRISTRFMIEPDGSVSGIGSAGSDLSDPAVVSCVTNAFRSLSFPQPEGGAVTVVQPILFQPGAVAPEAPAPSPRTPVHINVFIGDLPRQLLGCSVAASAPFEERVGLWRERLSQRRGDADAVVQVYRSALGDCEAPTYRERARLLGLMLDAMPGVASKVGLYRVMTRELGAADTLYRGILARIRTPEEMRELHSALGLKNVDPGILAKLVSTTTDAASLAKQLRALVAVFPDDLALALELLYAYEDASAPALARDLARALRERPDADASVRTALGELYLRHAERAGTPEAKASLQAEGRRAFGEIVEFAPEDPVARRRLGDLLLSHGFYADAARQYETLARLTPDDAQVLLLRARAAEGQGLLEEALKWSEKGGASGPPDGTSGPAATSRALAATHLAWARLTAAEAKRTEELTALRARATRVLSGAGLAADSARGARVSLTWSHPELHPSLWSNALGTAMPAPDGDVTVGVVQAIVPGRPDAFVEVRLEPADLAHAARLGASAELTVVFDELSEGEVIVRKRITFARGGPATQRYRLVGKEVQGG
ncbi:MAG: AgmX/PglI C-terminal domain-containing protein [Myxococcales bacterium]|nr:MAG: AgmX/PglI C-terminal domain-containing protein [Myxococcales bacterium]